MQFTLTSLFHPYHQGVFLGMSLLSIYKEIVRIVTNFCKRIKNDALRQKNAQVTRVKEKGKHISMRNDGVQNVWQSCTDLVIQQAITDNVSLALVEMRKEILDMNGKIAEFANALEELKMEKYTKYGQCEIWEGTTASRRAKSTTGKGNRGSR